MPVLRFSLLLLLSWQLQAFKAAADLSVAPAGLESCVMCHGVELAGNQATAAPKLTGLPAWHLRQQLLAFQKGWRGLLPGDTTGPDMRARALVMTEKETAAFLTWQASLPVRPVQPRLAGNAEKGRLLYRSCSTCHGPDAGGNKSLKAPPLAGRNDWYLFRQLQYYRSGARGTGSGDVQGAVMRGSLAMLKDDEAMLDVLAYISSLQQD